MKKNEIISNFFLKFNKKANFCGFIVYLSVFLWNFNKIDNIHKLPTK